MRPSTVDSLGQAGGRGIHQRGRGLDRGAAAGRASSLIAPALRQGHSCGGSLPTRGRNLRAGRRRRGGRRGGRRASWRWSAGGGGGRATAAVAVVVAWCRCDPLPLDPLAARADRLLSCRSRSSSSREPELAEPLLPATCVGALGHEHLLRLARHRLLDDAPALVEQVEDRPGQVVAAGAGEVDAVAGRASATFVAGLVGQRRLVLARLVGEERVGVDERDPGDLGRDLALDLVDLDDVLLEVARRASPAR